MSPEFPYNAMSTVQEVMATPEGREEWKQHGSGIGVTFDLRPDSVNWKRMREYMARKDAEKKAKK